MTTPDPQVLAIDGGQSGSRWMLGDAEGADLPLRTDLPLWPQLRAIVERAPRADGVAFGLTGYVAGNEDVQELARALDVDVWVTHDSVTSHLGALGDGHGASIAAGTGSVILATSPDGAAQVDGNGWILGDEGSGFWIGAEAIRRALRQADGRDPRTSLPGVVEERFGDLPGLYVRIQASETRVADIAAFARTVLELDDPAATAIATEAGERLAAGAIAALRTAGWPTPVGAEVRLLGGVLAASTVHAALERVLVDAGVEASRIRRAEGGSLRGAAMLSALPPAHPLHARVERASVS